MDVSSLLLALDAHDPNFFSTDHPHRYLNHALASHSVVSKLWDISHVPRAAISFTSPYLLYQYFFGYLQYLSLTNSLQLSSPLKRPLPAHETERGHAVSPQLGHAGDGHNPFQDKSHPPESSGNRLTFHKYICTTSTITLDPSWMVHIIAPNFFFFFLMSVTFEIDHTFYKSRPQYD